jgi:hypothetical protein
VAAAIKHTTHGVHKNNAGNSKVCVQ